MAIEVIVPFQKEWWPRPIDEAAFRPFFAQTKLKTWRQPEDLHRVEAETYRRVSDDGWSAFRPYWQPPPQVTIPFFQRIEVRRRFDFDVRDEAQRPNEGLARFFMVQTKLATWRQPEDLHRVEAEAYRRVSDDGWSAFRPYWHQPVPPPTVLKYNVVTRWARF